MIPLRQGLATAAVLAALGSAVACENGVFAPRAPARHTASLSIATELTGGSASAFDKVTAIHVTLASEPLVFEQAPVGGPSPGAHAAAAATNAATLDTTVTFKSGDEVHIKLPVEMSGSTETAAVTIVLLAGGSMVFNGSASVTLKPGENTVVTVPLSPWPGAVTTVGVPSFTAIGDTIYGRGAVLFSTGDTIRGAAPGWISLSPTIVAIPRDSLLVALAEGTGQVRLFYGPLSQTVTVLVNAQVASVAVSPRNPTVQLSTGVQQFVAVARDRRGNALVRTPNWTSSSTRVATVDSRGTVTLLSAGSTWIGAAVGTVRDSTLLTVLGVPAAPSNVSLTGASSQQVYISWNDNSTDESEFRIERCQGAGCTGFTQVFTNTPPDPRTTGVINSYDAPLTTLAVYSYRVRACNTYGCSAYSGTASGTTLPAETTLPVAPTNVVANAPSSTRVEIYWTHPGTNVVGFSVEWGTPLVSATFTEVARLVNTGARGVYVVASPYTYYQFRIRAFNAAGYSNYSGIVSVTTPP